METSINKPKYICPLIQKTNRKKQIESTYLCIEIYVYLKNKEEGEKRNRIRDFSVICRVSTFYSNFTLRIF